MEITLNINHRFQLPTSAELLDFVGALLQLSDRLPQLLSQFPAAGSEGRAGTSAPAVTMGPAVVEPEAAPEGAETEAAGGKRRGRPPGAKTRKTAADVPTVAAAAPAPVAMVPAAPAAAAPAAPLWGAPAAPAAPAPAAPAAPAPVAAATAPAVPAANGSVASIEQIKAAFTELLYMDGGEVKIQAVMSAHGLAFIADAKPEQYVSLLSALIAGKRT